MSKTKVTRSAFNAIDVASLPPATQKIVANLFADAKDSKKVDEHGNWEFGSEWEKSRFGVKPRGWATNWDLYAVGRDFFTKRTLIVIQIRKSVRHRKNGYLNTSKSYFLIGKNEDNGTFAHPVESRVIHSAIKRDDDVIRACQNWMFDADYTRVQRQGDLCLVPFRRTPIGAQPLELSRVIFQDSHELIAEQIAQLRDYLYAKNPVLTHLPATHPQVRGSGWFKVIVSKRGNFHDFAVPTVD